MRMKRTALCLSVILGGQSLWLAPASATGTQQKNIMQLSEKRRSSVLDSLDMFPVSEDALRPSSGRFLHAKDNKKQHQTAAEMTSSSTQTAAAAPARSGSATGTEAAQLARQVKQLKNELANTKTASAKALASRDEMLKKQRAAIASLQHQIDEQTTRIERLTRNAAGGVAVGAGIGSSLTQFMQGLVAAPVTDGKSGQTVAQLQQQLREKEKALQDLQQKLAQTRATGGQSADVQRLAALADEAQQTLNNERMRWRGQQLAMQRQIADLQQKVANGAAGGQASAESRQLTTLKDALQTAQAKLDSEQQQWQKDRQALQTKISELEKQLAQNSQQSAQKGSEQIAALTKDLQTSQQTLDSERQQWKKTYQQMQQQLDELHSQLADKQMQTDKTQKAGVMSGKDAAKLQQQLDAERLEWQNMEKALNQRVRALETQLENARKESAQQVQQQSSLAALLSQSTVNLNLERQRWAEQQRNAQQRIAALEKAGLTGAAADKDGALAKQLAEKNAQNDALLQRNEQLQAELTALKAQASNAGSQSTKRVKPVSEEQRLSYANGVVFGKQLNEIVRQQKEVGLDLDHAALRQGFNDELDGKRQMSDRDVDLAMQAFSTKTNTRLMTLSHKAEREAAAFLKDFEKQKGVKKSAKGFSYVIVKAGNATRVKPGGAMALNIREALNTGVTVSDSMAAEGQPVTFAYDNLPKVLQQAIGLIGEGGRIRVAVQASKVYGPEGSLPLIPPKAILVYDIDLVQAISMDSLK